jgi:hypothetical protein
MKRTLAILLALSLITLFAFGCDGGGVCTDNAFVLGAMTATLYRPCSGGPYPATTMTSGFLGTEGNVAWLARDAAAAGYVVLAMTPTNPIGLVSGWRVAHTQGVQYLKGLTNKVNPNKVGTCGHSKGGGGALWAASNLGSQVQTAIGMAPWQEEFLSLSGIRAATLIQSGLTDTLAVGVMTLNEYNLLPNSISRAYFTYGVGHMAWASNTNPKLSRDVVAWLDYYLNCDDSAASTLRGGGTWVDKGNCGSGSSSGSSGGCN